MKVEYVNVNDVIKKYNLCPAVSYNEIIQILEEVNKNRATSTPKTELRKQARYNEKKKEV